jgi:anti-sigma regulatory factor (Ser/Thr protein kinase)
MRKVRNFMNAALAALCDPDTAADIVLATSELLVNELRHGANAGELQMELGTVRDGVGITLRNVTITETIYRDCLGQAHERKEATGQYYRPEIGMCDEASRGVSAGLGLYLVDHFFTKIEWFEGGVTLIKAVE